VVAVTGVAEDSVVAVTGAALVAAAVTAEPDTAERQKANTDRH
jgi:hypothetical protein